MSTRRVGLSNLRKEGDRIVADVTGLSGEEFTSEVLQTYGLSSNPESGGESLSTDHNSDPDNHTVLPPAGQVLADKATTVLYHGATKIILHESGKIELEGSGDIVTKMDVISNGVSLQKHRHNTGKEFTPTYGPIV